MPIRFRCQCGQKLRVGDDKVGQRAKCPRCKTFVTVPAGGDPAEESVAHEPTQTSAPAEQLATEQPTAAPVRSVQDAPPTPMDGEMPPSETEASEALVSISVSHPESAKSDEAEPHNNRIADGAWVPVSVGSPLINNPSSNPVNALPEIVIRDDSIDWVRDADVPSLRAETVIDYDKVAVPRRVLYLQGILLGVVALVSFVLGMLMRQEKPREEVAGRPLQPCTLSGQVTYEVDGQPRPDDGSVVIILPVDRRPANEVRVAIEGLRPLDPVPNDENLSLRRIRSLGGDYARTNENGEYRMRLPSGRYHVLIISRRSSRSSTDAIEMADVAQIGRYFASVTELLNDRKYQWRMVTLQRDETQDTIF